MLNICCHGLTVRCDLNSITEFFIHAAHTEKRIIRENILGRNFFPLWSLSWGSGRTWKEDFEQEEIILIGTRISYHPIHKLWAHVFHIVTYWLPCIFIWFLFLFKSREMLPEIFTGCHNHQKEPIKNLGILSWKAFLDSSCNPGLHRNWNWE